MHLGRSWIIAVVMIGACGHGKKPDDHTGSAGSAGSAAGSGSMSWSVIGFRGSYAIVGADDSHHAAVIAPDARIAGRITVSNLDVLKSAVVAKDVLVWADATGVRAWDLAKGAERWHADPEPGVTRLVAGGDDVAALHPKGVDVFKLADGTRAYHREGAGGIDGKWRDGTFVFSDASGGIEAVDESTSKQRWTAKLDADKVTFPGVILTGNDALVFDGGRTLHDDGSMRFDSGPFTEVELATGKVKSTGTIDDTVPGSFEPGSQGGIGYSADGGTFVQAKPTKGPEKVFRRDPVGRVMWSASGWPLEQTSYDDNATLLRDGGAVQALVLKPRAANGKPAHLLVVFDAATGKLHFKHALDPHGAFLGLVQGCAIVIEPDGGKLTCLDDAKGTARWTRPLAGDPSGFGLKDANSFLVIDANPPVLRRIDATNQVQWQLELPNGVVPKPGDVGAGIVVLASGHGLSVIDLATGKIATATP